MRRYLTDEHVNIQIVKKFTISESGQTVITISYEHYQPQGPPGVQSESFTFKKGTGLANIMAKLNKTSKSLGVEKKISSKSRESKQSKW